MYQKKFTSDYAGAAAEFINAAIDVLVNVNEATASDNRVNTGYSIKESVDLVHQNMNSFIEDIRNIQTRNITKDDLNCTLYDANWMLGNIKRIAQSEIGIETPKEEKDVENVDEMMNAQNTLPEILEAINNSSNQNVEPERNAANWDCGDK